MRIDHLGRLAVVRTVLLLLRVLNGDCVLCNHHDEENYNDEENYEKSMREIMMMMTIDYGKGYNCSVCLTEITFSVNQTTVVTIFIKTGDNDDINNGDDDGDNDDSVDFESYSPLEQPLDLRWSPGEQV